MMLYETKHDMSTKDIKLACWYSTKITMTTLLKIISRNS